LLANIFTLLEIKIALLLYVMQVIGRGEKVLSKIERTKQQEKADASKPVLLNRMTESVQRLRKLQVTSTRTRMLRLVCNIRWTRTTPKEFLFPCRNREATV
jgi:hypothetical protein